jgi:cysteinyl-tRNA synthetase
VLRRIKNYQSKSGKVSKEVSNDLQYFIQEYVSRLEDDFNTPEALAVSFEFIKFVNTGIDAETFSTEEVAAIVDIFKTFDQVLSVFDLSILEAVIEIPSEILALVQSRIEAKQNKDFTLADELR